MTATANHTLLAFDGYNIVRRVYGAVPGDDSPEKVEGAFKSSLGSFKRALADFEPSFVFAAFDHGGHTFRHDMFPEYRLNRKPMPELLKAAMPTLHDMLRDIGIQVVSVPGVEADDVLGSVTLRWTSAGRGRAIIISTDKDLAQLAESNVEVRDQFQNHFLDEAWCQKKFGVPVRLIGDALALMGDASDGIPGVPNVGVKTAAKWLMQFGSLDALLSRADEVTGAVGERLRSNIEMAKLSRELVRLKTDVKLNLKASDFLYDGNKKDALN